MADTRDAVSGRISALAGSRHGITWQIALVLGLGAAGGLAALGLAWTVRSEMSMDGMRLNEAGRHRMLAERLGRFADRVYALDQDRPRPALEDLVHRFDQRFEILLRGGDLRGTVLPPAPSEIGDALGVMEERWLQLRPALLSVARLDGDDPEAGAAYGRVQVGVPLLVQAADRVTAQLQARGERLQRRFLVWLALVASLDLALVFVGLRAIRRYLDERQRGEEERRLLSGVIEQTSDMVIITDTKGHIVYANPAAETTTGYSQAELLGQTPRIFKSGAHSRQEYAALWDTILAGQTFEKLFVNRAKNGALFYVDKKITPLKDGHDRIQYFVCTDRDITDRRQAELERQKAEANYEWLAENATDVIGRYAADGTCLYVSSSCQALLEYGPEELVGRSEFERVHPQDVGRVRQCYERLGGQLDTCLASYRLRRKDGRFIWAESALRSVADPQTGVVGEIIGVTRDVSERRRQEALQAVLHQLREAIWTMAQPDDLRHLLEALTAGLATLDVRMHACGINVVDASREPPGVRTYTLVGDAELDTETYEEGTGLIPQIWRRGETCYRRDLEHEDLHQERASLMPVHGRVRSVLDLPFSHGTLAVNSLDPDAFSGRDIADLQAVTQVLSEGFQRLDDLERLAAQDAQLRQAQKMEAIGQLAGGVAHDFNNLITIIGGYGAMLARNLPAGSREHDQVAQIRGASDRAATLVRQLLAFGRRQVLELRGLDLSRLVGDMESMLRRLVPENIEIISHLADDLAQVYADAGQIEQVLLNLVTNARDAMPAGGQLTIRTADAELDEIRARRHAEPVPGPYVLLAVSDTGTGMDEETQARIFEPFFTTKGEGIGSGLGLATVYGIVKQSGGHIRLDSEPGHGTTFEIYLPRADTAAAAGGAALAAGSGLPEEAQGTETILLVEDEDLVRELARRALAEYGYDVVAAADGDTALTAAREREGAVALVLADVIMPGMSGPDLVRRLRPLCPAAKVLFTSGYVDQGLLDDGALPPGAHFLPKPFDPERLARKVRDVLDGA